MFGKAHMVWHRGEMLALDTDSMSERETFMHTAYFIFQAV